MCFKFVLCGLLSISFRDAADGIPIHLIEDNITEGFRTNINTTQVQSRKEDLNIATVNSFLLDKPLVFDYASGQSTTISLTQQTQSETLDAPDEQIIAIRLQKRDVEESDSILDQLKAEKSIGDYPNKEARASSIPFLPKQESEGQSGSGGGLIPGLPSMPGLPDSSNTPMAVIGGFQMVLMPMPGLTMSNIGSAMQAGQQFSQLVPGMPSIPG